MPTELSTRLQLMLRPSSVAIAGAAERDTSAGGAVLKLMKRSGYTGRIVPVNPKGGNILGIDASTSLAEVTPTCDLVIIAVRADHILGVVKEGVASGHRNFLVLPGGFREAGPIGVARDQELRHYAQAHDLLILGPNCAGLINLLDPSAPYAGSFFKDMPFRGYDSAQRGVALVTQSGAIGEEVIASSHALKIPLGSVISVGNGMHADLVDYIAAVAEEPNCGVILFYAESVGDPDRFIDVVRPIARRIPVVGLLGGATNSGTAAAERHTGSKPLGDRASDVLCARSGVIRVQSLRHLLLAAKALAYFPSGTGRRTLILSNSGGPGVLVADQCQREGLELPPLPNELERDLKKILPPEATVANPIDLLADAREDRFAPTLQAALRHAQDRYEAILMIHIVPFMVDAKPVVDALATACRGASIPIMHSMMGTLADRALLFEAMERVGVPTFVDSEAMAYAAGVLARRGEVN